MLARLLAEQSGPTTSLPLYILRTSTLAIPMRQKNELLHDYCRTPLIASAAQNLVNLSLDLFFVFVAGWGVVGSASAATIGQYVGLATILVMLGRKGMLTLSDLRSWPKSEELVPMAQAGFGLAFCIGAVMCSVMGATTMATG